MTADTLGPKAVVGVMTPAMNTVVQPELETLRPPGVTNQMQRFRLGGERVSDDLAEEASKLMDCRPLAIAIGLTTDAAPGGVTKLSARTAELQAELGVPVRNASEADHEALRALGAKRVAVVTPFDPKVNETVRANVEAAGFTVVAIDGTRAPSLEAICTTPPEAIRAVFERVAEVEADAILQVGTALPVLDQIETLEATLGKPIVACNAAVYWSVLRAIGLDDRVPGYGTLLREH